MRSPVTDRRFAPSTFGLEEWERARATACTEKQSEKS